MAQTSGPVYRLYIDEEDAFAFLPEGVDWWDFYETFFSGGPFPEGWRPPPHRAHRLGPEKEETSALRTNDFILGWRGAPYLSERAVGALTGILARNEAEFVRVGRVNGVDYYAMNVLRVVDCVDKAKSKISWTDGGVCQIWEYAFREEAVPKCSVFKVPQDSSEIFVRESFVECVLEHRLTGVGVDDPMRRDGRSRVPGLPVTVGSPRR